MTYLQLHSVVLKEIEPRMEEQRETIKACHDILHGQETALEKGISEMIGWVDYPATRDDAFFTAIESLAAKIKKESTALVLVGIGGSFLGARSALKWLRNEIKGKGIDVYYAGWNLSGSYHARLLEELAEKDVSLCVVSKSGKTMETAFCFEVLKDFMRKKYGDGFKDRVYVVTDAHEGLLRQETEAEGYHSLPVEENIGGRYSVLTAVGLLPMAAGGIDIRRLMVGARCAYEDLSSPSFMENPAYRYAVLRNYLYENGKILELFSTMEPHMQSFAQWLRQLFGESEGKKGRGVFPACIKYSADLHSLGQYIQEGTPNFFETLISVEKSGKDLPIRFDGKTYNEMNDITCRAVVAVREKSGTPLIQCKLKDFSEETLGYAMYFFEKACAMCCLLQGLNPFDQPGVELYKSEILKILKKDS